MVSALGTKQTWVVSAIAHGVLLAIAQFGLPHFFDEPETRTAVIPVEIVELGSMTTPPEPAAPEAKQEAAQAAAPPPPPQRPPEPPQARVPDPEVAAAPPPPPQPKAPEPKPEPPKAEPAPTPEPETRMAAAAPVKKPKPPTPSRDFSSVLKDLAADAPETPPKKTARVVATPQQQAEPAPARPQVRATDIATITAIDALRVAIRRQIEPCWSPPIGAREADELTVKIVVHVEPSGHVRRAEVVDPGRMALNPFFEAAADSARRAVLNDRCNPLKDLPPDKYDLWQELELTFNPKDALG